jgi:hypothetical protein
MDYQSENAQMMYESIAQDGNLILRRCGDRIKKLAATSYKLELD